MSLRSQPAPHEERKNQHQRACAVVNAQGQGPQAQFDPRKSHPDQTGESPMASLLLAGVTDAAGGAAFAPIAADGMPGKGNRGKRS